MLESFLYTLVMYGVVMAASWAYAILSPRR
jgi:hypothetical protein